MGVMQLVREAPPPLSTVHVLCPFQCKINGIYSPSIELDLCHEDEDSVQWTGACIRCGKEYHLTYMKDPQ